MDRVVTYGYENGGWRLAVRSNERETLTLKTFSWAKVGATRVTVSID